MVRRDTGGGAMFIEPQNTITYSLYVPEPVVAGLDARQCYQFCDMWLLEALAACGVRAHFAGLNDIASAAGKIGGAAERRFPASGEGPGCLLHHDTLAYAMNTEHLQHVLRPSKEKMSDKAVKSASKRVDPMNSQTSCTRAQIVDCMLETASRFGVVGNTI